MLKGRKRNLISLGMALIFTATTLSMPGTAKAASDTTLDMPGTAKAAGDYYTSDTRQLGTSIGSVYLSMGTSSATGYSGLTTIGGLAVKVKYTYEWGPKTFYTVENQNSNASTSLYVTANSGHVNSNSVSARSDHTVFNSSQGVGWNPILLLNAN